MCENRELEIQISWQGKAVVGLLLLLGAGRGTINVLIAGGVVSKQQKIQV